MKVLFISDVAYPWVKGGSEYMMFKISQILGAKHQVDFLCGKWWSGAAHQSNYYGVRMFRNIYHGRRSVVSAVSFTASLLFELPKITQKYDIIEINQSPMLDFTLLDVIRRSSFASNAPLVGALHEIWQEYWLEYAGILSGVIGYGLEYQAAKKLDHIITISDFNRSKLARWGIPLAKVSVMRPGVDITEINSSPLSDRSSDIVFVGRLVFEKRVDVLINAVGILKRKYGKNDAKVIIIGDGPMLNTLKKLTDEQNLATQIAFLGRIENHSDVYSLMKASKVLVYPAPPEGGWSISLVEANAAGLPAITSSRNEIGVGYEVVIDGENGYVSPELSPESFAYYLNLLLDNEPLRASLSLSSVAYASKFDWKNIADQTEKIFLSVIESKRNN